jgi:hypothetical protein
VHCINTKEKPVSDIQNAIEVAKNLESLKKASNKTEISENF